jgi:hypothetical protein
MVPLGKSNGLMCFNKMAAEEKTCYTQKSALRDRMMGVLRNDKHWKQVDAEEGKKFMKFMGMASGCCVCLPMHINKIKADNARDYKKAQAEFEKQY